MFFTKKSQNRLCNAQVENLHPKAMEMLLCMGTMSTQTHGDAALHGQDGPLSPQPMEMLLCMHRISPFPSP